MKAVSQVALFCLGLILITTVCEAADDNPHLRKKFYKHSCPDAENIVKTVISDIVSKNNKAPPQLLRMHFHDCFVRGCDASVLLNSNSTNSAEKEAVPNQGIRGSFGIIDQVKAKVEESCPGVVSCADILALAARDAVSVQFGTEMWEVLTGRRDGSVSRASEALTGIPSPSNNFTTLLQNFASKGLTRHDLVVLSGAHTIGVGNCTFFVQRLYNFSGNGGTDPSLDPNYAASLKKQCPSITSTNTVPMDPTPLNFDSLYYNTVKANRGLFTSDSALTTDKQARNILTELETQSKFFTEFAQSMKSMGKVGVLTGKNGEIRKKCGVVN